jgi:hypothetical protein
MNKRLPIKRLSICSCGFPLFNEYVKLGDTYEVDTSIVCNTAMRCGGCKTTFDAPSYMVIQNYKLIPVAAFEDEQKVN